MTEYPSEIETDYHLESAKAIYDAYKKDENMGTDLAPDPILPKWEDLPEDVKKYFVAASAALGCYLHEDDEPNEDGV